MTGGPGVLAPDPLTLADVEDRARAVLAPEVYDFVAGGSGDESTLHANRTAFDRCHLVPRVLNGVETADTTTTLLGAASSMPVAVAPMAFHSVVHPDGEPAVSRAAAAAGIPFTAATLASRPLDELVPAGGELFLQLYWLRDRARTAWLIAEAERLGARALILTVDVPFMGRRLRDLRNGFAVPAHAAPVNLADTQRGAGQTVGGHAAAVIDPTLSWADLEWVRRRTRLPLVLKGVLDPADARRAVDLGADGLVVSNHGGRQLDGAVPSLFALPAIRDEVGDACELLLDSGVRGGTDVLRALALGASGVLLGRPVLWGLADGGESGVTGALRLLRTELEVSMALAGAPNVAAARRLGVRWAPGTDEREGS
ncbi:alpha-hydroxy acid oxidase [Streptomyces showdoensis]|uniref:2-hydroxy-acid oxidase n=1 Tax=Streptomyces showdoensis TaxID=68268 RepID=A0A2P2GUM9_STREW|nr:alpha-hydroxy acid oxidase [Streptomyces showdoensis]KKZ75190.1 2-hydroxy-acid oxidase [Streptomyces showdoensis]